jgi:hypothetical protein
MLGVIIDLNLVLLPIGWILEQLRQHLQSSSAQS